MAEHLDELEDRDLARRLEGLVRVESDLNSRVDQQALAVRGPASPATLWSTSDWRSFFTT